MSETFEYELNPNIPKENRVFIVKVLKKTLKLREGCPKCKQPILFSSFLFADVEEVTEFIRFTGITEYHKPGIKQWEIINLVLDDLKNNTECCIDLE